MIGQVMTVKEIVAGLAGGLDRDVEYRDIPDEAWAAAAATRLNPHAVAHLSQLWASFRNRSPAAADFAVTDTIEKLGGGRPTTFDEFMAEEKAGFPARRLLPQRVIGTATRRRTPNRRSA